MRSYAGSKFYKLDGPLPLRQRGARKVVVRGCRSLRRGLHRMETKDAWILLAGAFLGFLGSLLATFTAPSVGSAFGKLN